MISINDFQQNTASTAIYPGAGSGSLDAIGYCGLGLAGEAGEVANLVKKLIRDGEKDSQYLRMCLREELGDVAWYFARLCSELGYDAADVLVENMQKLAGRKSRGTLGGSGNR